VKEILLDECFSNVTVALTLCLTVPYLAFKGARSFSGLSHIKSGGGTLHMEHLNWCRTSEFVNSSMCRTWFC